MSVDASTPRRAAVLGHPIAHSLSPVLHRTAYAGLGLSWQYDAIDVTTSALADFVDSLGPEWIGLSLTMPLKECVLPLLDQVDPDAEAVRAVNTVVFEGSRRSGFNTDITGLTGLLRAAGVGGRDGGSESALVLGAGATARSSVAALARSDIGSITIAARRPEAAGDVVTLAASLDVEATVAPWPVPVEHLASDVVVTTVPFDAVSGLAPPARPGVLVDVLYHPWPTPLATAWSRAGGTVVGGLELLVRQAVEQVELMAGRRPDIEAMRAAGQAALAERADAALGASGIAQAEQ